MWKFAIDVGGTFTDVVATSPDHKEENFKVLSSGRVKWTDFCIKDEALRLYKSQTPLNLYIGYSVDFISKDGDCIGCGKVKEVTGDQVFFDQKVPEEIKMIEVYSHEPSPLLAIRQCLGIKLDEKIPPLELKMGTTRGTNALLERKGAKCGWVTTKGFGDQ